MTATILDRVKKICEDQLGCDPEAVTPDAVLTEDLGADSLDQVELVMAMESEFAIDVPDDVAEKWKTVGDAVRYIEGAAPRTDD